MRAEGVVDEGQRGATKQWGELAVCAVSRTARRPYAVRPYALRVGLELVESWAMSCQSCERQPPAQRSCAALVLRLVRGSCRIWSRERRPTYSQTRARAACGGLSASLLYSPMTNELGRRY